MHMDAQEQKALERALRALAARAHTQKELSDKLSRSGYSQQAIAYAMEVLTRYGLLDDAAFAQEWVNARAKRAVGPYRLRQELRKKGVSAEVSQGALDALSEEKLQQAAVHFAAKRLQNGDRSPQARRRAFQALLRRGYDYDTARAALEEALAEEIEE